MKYLTIFSACILVVVSSVFIGSEGDEKYEAMNREKLMNTTVVIGNESVRLVPAIACVQARSCDFSGHFKVDQYEAEELGAPTIELNRGQEIHFDFDTTSPSNFTFSKMDLLSIEGGNIEDDTLEILGQRGNTVYYTFRAKWGDERGLQTFVTFPVFFRIK